MLTQVLHSPTRHSYRIAALQVLGLTKYSHWEEAGALRACARGSPGVRAQLLSVALGRLESMVHVGLMEQLDLSVASLAVRRHLLQPSQLPAHLRADCARQGGSALEILALC